MQFIKGQRHVITDHSQCEDDVDGVVTCPDDVTGEHCIIELAHCATLRFDHVITPEPLLFACTYM